MTFLIAVLAAFLQPAAPAAEPPAEAAEESADERAPSRGGAIPDLDDLLGLEDVAEEADEAGGEGGEARVDEAPLRTPEEEALDRQLSGEDPGEQFEQAAELMNEAAWRIGGSGDIGLATQRMHEDILRKLDQVIAAAEQNQQQSSSSSSSSSSQQQQQQQQPQQGGQQQQQQQNAQGDGEQEASPSDSTDAQLTDAIPASGAAWGALPARVRDALLQGINDPFSSIYQRQTEAYYRRLAEEPAP